MAAANIELVVIHPFGPYQIGDVITEAAEIDAALTEYRTHVSPRAALAPNEGRAAPGADA